MNLKPKTPVSVLEDDEGRKIAADISLSFLQGFSCVPFVKRQLDLRDELRHTVLQTTLKITHGLEIKRRSAPIKSPRLNRPN